MDTIQLTTVCTEDPYIQPLFYGVIAIDKLPTKWPSIGMYIINQDIQTGPGIHWYALALGLEGPKRAAFVDTFGRQPPPTITNSLTNQGFTIYYNDVQLQSVLTSQCGELSLVFLKLWARGYTSLEILKKFMTDQTESPFQNEFFSKFFLNQTV